MLIELSWQHYHLLSSLEGEENSILLALILWKAKQSAVFLRMLLLPFKINDDLKDSVHSFVPIQAILVSLTLFCTDS